jgi:uncharacterized protein (TIGR00661 family)
MTRIIYGVAGEGFGHSSRTHLIGQHLIDAGNEVMFIASQKAYTYLAQHFPSRTREMFGLCLAYRNRRLSCTRAFTTNLINFCRNFRGVAGLLNQSFGSFCPDLVISDFEPFTAWWAWHNKVPFVSIDHEHVLTMCKLRHNPRDWHPRLTSSMVTRGHYFGASAYVVLNFFHTSVKTDTTILAPPVVRSIVHSHESATGEHILLYTTDRTGRDKLIRALQSLPKHRFYIYGFDENSESGNCVFKRTSIHGFLRDLATCRGVIGTAGFSLISECLHFKKRMLLLPISGQYEQMINGKYVEALGLGISRRSLDPKTLEEFLSSIDEPFRDEAQIMWPDNDAFFQVLHKVLRKVGTEANAATSRNAPLAIE